LWRVRGGKAMNIRYWLITVAASVVIGGCNINLIPSTAEETAAPTAVEAVSEVTPEPGSLNLLATVLATDDLSVLGSALVAAGIAPELEGDTAYTLLAPTNSAFEELPAGVLDRLLADPAALADVLRYHLIADAIASADLAPLGSALSVQGEPLAVALSQDAALLLNDAQVIEADIAAANGVIHKLDKVLLPTTAQALLVASPSVTDTATVLSPVTGTVTASVTSTTTALLSTPTPGPSTALTGTGSVTPTAAITASVEPTGTTPATATVAVTGATTLTSTAPAGQTIVDVLASRPDLSTISSALAAGGLAEALAEPGPFTFFAPTNAAFERVAAVEAEALLNDIPRLARTLQYHIVADRATAQQLARLGSALTTLGQTVTITLSGNGALLANGAPVLESIETENGIVHLLDGILIPAEE
jgi:transforming growth factor-beta-induced protein